MVHRGIGIKGSLFHNKLKTPCSVFKISALKKVFWDGGLQNSSWDNIDLDQETQYYKPSQALECISEKRIIKRPQLLTALLENQEPS